MYLICESMRDSVTSLYITRAMFIINLTTVKVHLQKKLTYLFYPIFDISDIWWFCWEIKLGYLFLFVHLHLGCTSCSLFGQTYTSSCLISLRVGLALWWFDLLNQRKKNIYVLLWFCHPTSLERYVTPWCFSDKTNVVFRLSVMKIHKALNVCSGYSHSVR